MKWPVKVITHYKVDIIHNLIVLSKDPEAKIYPSFEKDILVTPSKCPERIFIHSPFATLHKRIVLSSEHEAKYCSSLVKATPETSPNWPFKEVSSWMSTILLFFMYSLYTASKNVSFPLYLSLYSLSPVSIELSPYL